jgi:copper chaperone CopZ
MDKTQTITISGMTCDACVKLITKFFSRIPGVTRVIRVEKTGIAEVAVNEVLPVQAFTKALPGTQYSIVSIT